MKKIIAVLLSGSLLLSLCACGAVKPEETAPVTEETTAPTTEETSAPTETTEDPLAEDREYLSAFGDVSIENGLLTVSITIPASMAGENPDQAKLDEEAGTTYQSAKINEDGSITFKLTRSQHKQMLDDLRASVDQ